MVSPIGFADIGKASYSTGDSADAGSFREAFVGTVVFPLFSTYLLQFHLSILDLSCGCGRIPTYSGRNFPRGHFRDTTNPNIFLSKQIKTLTPPQDMEHPNTSSAAE
jgi:hypothetical protein